MIKSKFNTYKKFFDEKGLTSTSANYIANIAKEIISADKPKFNFIDVFVHNINTPDVKERVERGMTEEDIYKLDEYIENSSKLSALMAWLREAIKAKDHMLNEIENYDFNNWIEENGIEMYKTPTPEWDKEYGVDEVYTENDYINDNMNIKEVNEYLYLSSMCSILGKMIHPNGEYAEAKKAIHEKDGNTSLRDYSSDVIVYKYSASTPIDVIDKKFFELQNKQREYQKRLNKIKFEIENNVKSENDKRYTEVLKWKEEVKTRNAENVAERARLNAQFWNWKNKKLNEIRSLKIVIPNDLESVYQLINNYGK